MGLVAAEPGAFVVGFVPGVMPDKWRRIWARRRDRTLVMKRVEESAQQAALRSGELDMCLVRGVERSAELHLIPLYTEQPVIVVSAEHPAAAYDELDVRELVGDLDVLDAYPGLALRDRFATVAAGTGYLVVPAGVARVNRRKDVAVVRALGVTPTAVGLAWLAGHDDPDVETFIGIVRGRTPRSSR